MEKFQRVSLYAGLVSILTIVLAYLFNFNFLMTPFSVAASLLLAFGIGSVKILKPYQYTAWIIAAIVCGLLYPNAFLNWGEFDLRNKWIILIVIQFVMFGMGTQMSIKDFTGIRTMGKGVLVGIISQFSIMPLTGYVLTRIFNFEPEIAAGVILIGSSSSGLASNVMVYLAKANLTLSVTLTAIATLLAPIMTPLMMKIFAGTYIEINFLNMCIQIIKIVIVPIGAAMIFDAYKNYRGKITKRLNIAALISSIWLIANILFLWKIMDSHLSTGILKIAELLNFIAGAVVAGKLFYHLTKVIPSIINLMPKLSMFGIVYFTLVTTAASRNNILAIGIFMLLASIIHNSLGYTFGYGLSKILGLDKQSCRTVALEVGLQNGGMATGLAGVMGKLATVGLASAIFSPWMNISGSLLANYWRKTSKHKTRK